MAQIILVFWQFVPQFVPQPIKMLFNTTISMLLKYQLVALFFKVKYKDIKKQLSSHNNAFICYHILTLDRHKLWNQLYYIHTTEYLNIRKDLHFQSDIPSLTSPN